MRCFLAVPLAEPALADAQRVLTMLRREMTNHQTGHKTLYSFDSFALDRSLQDAWFSTRRLEEQ